MVAVDRDVAFLLEPSNTASTGYTWIARPVDDALLHYDGCQYRGPNSSRIGAPGSEVFLFHAGNVPGLVDLTFDYVRLWEVPLQPVQTRQIQIDVVAARPSE
jgi:predicted secreted protein